MGLVEKVRSLFTPSKLDVARRFEILREAVHGTMSNFYKVRDRQTGAILGLKVCDREKTAFFENRFLGLSKPSEGEIAMRFDHRCIVKTFEYGTTTAGEHYLLMEYLDGPGLNAFILQKSRELAGKRLALLQQMVEAMCVVHEAGFIHRDVCPRNFICSKDGSSLKLIDFGLTLPAEKAFMQPGNRTGTPSYMAPEIIRRRSTDQRLDIFSFGVTAFQLCTYELPWPGQDVSGKAAVAHDTKAPLDIFSLRPQLNRKLGELIMNCLAREPQGRPASFDVIHRHIRLIDSEQE
jgi:serine/threonine-protein kinase